MIICDEEKCGMNIQMLKLHLHYKNDHNLSLVRCPICDNSKSVKVQTLYKHIVGNHLKQKPKVSKNKENNNSVNDVILNESEPQSYNIDIPDADFSQNEQYFDDNISEAEFSENEPQQYSNYIPDVDFSQNEQLFDENMSKIELSENEPQPYSSDINIEIGDNILNQSEFKSFNGKQVITNDSNFLKIINKQNFPN